MDCKEFLGSNVILDKLLHLLTQIFFLLVMAVFVITLSSPLFASSPSSTSRYDTILMYIYQFLFPVTGKYFAPADIQVIDTRRNGGDWLGGDADDYANGKNTTYSYNDKNLRLNRIDTQGIQDLNYTYDSVGNIKTISDALAGMTESFDYDDLDRLTQAGDSSYDRQYQYNSIGNMTSETKDGQTKSYTYGATAGPHAVKGVTGLLPVVGSFVIDDGNSFTNTNRVTLSNVSFGTPTFFMVSENANFNGAT